MAQWQNEQRPYEFEIKNEPFPSRVEAFGAVAEGERPNIILQDRSDNKGASVTSEKGRTACIDSICKAKDFKATEVNWYTRDKEGNLRGVDVGYETKTVPNESFAAFARSGEFNIHNIDEAKKYFPDEKVTELKTSVRGKEPAPEEMEKLKSSFASKPLDQQKETSLNEKQEAPKPEAPKQEELKQEAPPEKEKATPQNPAAKSAHEYDLSQERMRDR